jgi:hypothetical protein
MVYVRKNEDRYHRFATFFSVADFDPSAEATVRSHWTDAWDLQLAPSFNLKGGVVVGCTCGCGVAWLGAIRFTPPIARRQEKKTQSKTHARKEDRIKTHGQD